MVSANKFLKNNVLYITLFQSLVATMGSLFFSEVLKYPPCQLCWLQRIFMYPLSFILLVGILLRDKNVVYYVLPLSVVGWLIAVYHSLIYYQVIDEVLGPCTLGVSCTTKQFFWFGFLSIPLLSLIAFSVINVCVWWYWKVAVRPLKKSGIKRFPNITLKDL